MAGHRKNENKGKFDKAARKQAATQLIEPLQNATVTLRRALNKNVDQPMMNFVRALFDAEVSKLSLKCQTAIAKNNDSPEQRAFENVERANSTAICHALRAAAKVVKPVDTNAARDILEDVARYEQFCKQRALSEKSRLRHLHAYQRRH